MKRKRYFPNSFVAASSKATAVLMKRDLWERGGGQRGGQRGGDGGAGGRCRCKSYSALLPFFCLATPQAVVHLVTVFGRQVSSVSTTGSHAAIGRFMRGC